MLNICPSPCLENPDCLGSKPQCPHWCLLPRGLFCLYGWWPRGPGLAQDVKGSLLACVGTCFPKEAEIQADNIPPSCSPTLSQTGFLELQKPSHSHERETRRAPEIPALMKRGYRPNPESALLWTSCCTPQVNACLYQALRTQMPCVREPEPHREATWRHSDDQAQLNPS